ncbi:MAG: hypothetical protein QNJ71_11830 [Acidimicrobiia bacterium]|nr:hypothetical protein [Acidimicrobiia bacterium]
MTTDTQQETSPMADDPAAAATSPAKGSPTGDAQDAAKQILAKARYDAFRLVTDAREEAESILDEARLEAKTIVREAEEEARTIAEAAARKPEPPADEDATDGTTSSAVAELEAEHRELTDRVGSLRDLADELEARFAALAEGAHLDADGRNEAGDGETDILDYSPSVPHPPKRTSADDEDEAPVVRERGSFYSRRSAKLPRIGEDGGKSALDMMRSIRETLDEKDA